MGAGGAPGEGGEMGRPEKGGGGGGKWRGTLVYNGGRNIIVRERQGSPLSYIFPLEGIPMQERKVAGKLATALSLSRNHRFARGTASYTRWPA